MSVNNPKNKRTVQCTYVVQNSIVRYCTARHKKVQHSTLCYGTAWYSASHITVQRSIVQVYMEPHRGSSYRIMVI